MSDGNMIVVRNGCKFYGEEMILRDLEMTVNTSSIYCLLGASGCGKTTLLNCIVGKADLDSGTLHVNIGRRKHLGYMPQELALYDDLSIWETLSFFGTLFGMKRQEVKESLEKLKVVDLPPSRSQIKTLSGGERRRVSLAVALLADPKLLVLDEPTVGLDSILRESIWKFLRQLTQKGTTVLITTHYVQEAQDSDTVAFLRGGQILKESEPKCLLQEYNAQTLESVFLSLATQQDSVVAENPETPPLLIETSQEKRMKRSYPEDSTLALNRILAFVFKAFYFIKSNHMNFYFVLVLPALLFIILVDSTRKPFGYNVGYYNLEDDCSNADLLSCSSSLSCRIISKIQAENLNLIHLDDEKSALEAVSENKVWGVIGFKHNFTEETKKRLEFYYFFEDEIPEPGGNVWLDMSNYVLGFQMKKAFYDSYLHSVQEWYSACGWNPRVVTPNLKIEKPVYGDMGENGLTNSMAPGLVIVLPYTLATALGLILVLTERELGTQQRCKVYGLTMSEFFISQFLASFFICLLQCLLFILILYLYIDGILGNVLVGIGLLILEGIVGVLHGLFIATLTDNFSVALTMLTFYNTCVSYLAGMIWPQEGFHWIATLISKIVPMVVPMKSLMAVTTKGYSIFHYDVYIGFLNCIMWMFIFVSLIFINIRKK